MNLGLLLSIFIFSSPAISAGLKTEIQVNLCDHISALSTQLEFNPAQPKKIETTYYIENKNLDLYRQGWVFKIVKDDSKKIATITLKNNSMPSTDQNLNAKAKKCEFDLHGTFEKLACKVSSEIDLQDLEKILRKQKYSDLLSKEQAKWLKDENIVLPSDLIQSPAFIDRDYLIQADQLKTTLSFSTNFKNEDFLEISTRSDQHEDQFNKQKNLTDYLIKKNIHLCSDQGAVNTKNKLESVY